LILLAASGVSALTGDVSGAPIIGVIVVMSGTLDFVQAYRAGRDTTSGLAGGSDADTRRMAALKVMVKCPPGIQDMGVWKSAECKTAKASAHMLAGHCIDMALNLPVCMPAHR
jgi:hypothetical protein